MDALNLRASCICCSSESLWTSTWAICVLLASTALASPPSWTFTWATTSLLAAPTYESLDWIHLHHLFCTWLKDPSNSCTWKDLMIRITPCWHPPSIPNFWSSCSVMLIGEGMAYLSHPLKHELEAHTCIFPRFASNEGMGSHAIQVSHGLNCLRKHSWKGISAINLPLPLLAM